MTRVAMLRAGYAALGLAFSALAATLVVPDLLLAGLAVAFLAGIVLAFTADPLPKWGGIALVLYFVLSAVAFIAATPVTINRGGERFFANPAPPELAGIVIDWMGRLAPLLLSGAALAAAWERERAPRTLLTGALGGFAVYAVLFVALVPRGDDVASAVEAARTQAALLEVLFSVSAVAGAVGAFWAAARPEETGG